MKNSLISLELIPRKMYSLWKSCFEKIKKAEIVHRVFHEVIISTIRKFINLVESFFNRQQRLLSGEHTR